MKGDARSMLSLSEPFSIPVGLCSQRKHGRGDPKYSFGKSSRSSNPKYIYSVTLQKLFRLLSISLLICSWVLVCGWKYFICVEVLWGSYNIPTRRSSSFPPIPRRNTCIGSNQNIAKSSTQRYIPINAKKIKIGNLNFFDSILILFHSTNSCLLLFRLSKRYMVWLRVFFSTPFNWKILSFWVAYVA